MTVLERRRARQDVEIFGSEHHHANLAARADRADGFSVPLDFQPARIADPKLGDIGTGQRLGLARLQDSRKDLLAVAGDLDPGFLRWPKDSAPRDSRRPVPLC